MSDHGDTPHRQISQPALEGRHAGPNHGSRLDPSSLRRSLITEPPRVVQMGEIEHEKRGCQHGRGRADVPTTLHTFAQQRLDPWIGAAP